MVEVVREVAREVGMAAVGDDMVEKEVNGFVYLYTQTYCWTTVPFLAQVDMVVAEAEKAVATAGGKEAKEADTDVVVCVIGKLASIFMI